MADREVTQPALTVMPDVFIKRPGMFFGVPVRFDRVPAFIGGYTLAIQQVRWAIARECMLGRSPRTAGGRDRPVG